MSGLYETAKKIYEKTGPDTEKSERALSRAALSDDELVFQMAGVARRTLWSNFRRASARPHFSNRSKWETNQVAETYRRFLDDPILVGDTWKRVGECTVADILTVASKRREAAKDIERKADRFDLLAELMRRKRVKTVADLDQESIENALSDD